MKNTAIPSLSNPGIINRRAIITSNMPNKITNKFTGIPEIIGTCARVFSKSSVTIRLAGESPITFKIPNQKYITNKEILDKRIEVCFKVI